MKLTHHLAELPGPHPTTWEEAFGEAEKIRTDPERKLTAVAAVSESDYAGGFFQLFYFKEWRPRFGTSELVLGHLQGLMKIMQNGAKSFRICYGKLELVGHPFMADDGDDWLLVIVYR